MSRTVTTTTTGPYGINLYTGNGSTTSFAVTFGYLDTTHIKVYFGNDDGTETEKTITTDYTITVGASSTTVDFTSAPADGQTVIFRRVSPITHADYQAKVVDFVDNSVLTAADLDRSLQGLLYLIQEENDSGDQYALGYNLTGQYWDGRYAGTNQPLYYLAEETATTPRHAATTKGYVDDLVLYGASSYQPVAQAQSWTPSWTYNSTPGTITATLSSPTPYSTTAEMFIVEINGVIQAPSSYSIDSSNVITVTGMTGTPTSSSVRNFGVARNIFSGSGNTGIGTDSPETKLHVDGNVTIEDNAPTLRFKEKDTTNQNYQIQLDGGTLSFEQNNDAFDSSSTKFSILQDGKVGIGTTAPAEFLEIEGAGSAAKTFYTNTANTDGMKVGLGAAGVPKIEALGANALQFNTNSTERMSIESDGKVKIKSASGTRAELYLTEDDEQTIIKGKRVSDNNSELQFFTELSNTATQGMTLDKDGNLLVKGSIYSGSATDSSAGSDVSNQSTEGTFTPTVSISNTADLTSGSNITFKTGYDTLSYHRIGNLVTIIGHLKIDNGYTDSDNTGTVEFTNLQYTCKSGAENTAASQISQNTNASLTVSPSCITVPGTKRLKFYGADDGGDILENKAVGIFRNDDELYINLTYVTSDS